MNLLLYLFMKNLCFIVNYNEINRDYLGKKKILKPDLW